MREAHDEQALARLEQVQARADDDEQVLARFMGEHNLIKRHVELLISRDTMELWEAMGQRLGGFGFDGAVQALTLVGAATIAQMDLGLLPTDAAPVDPDKLRSIVWPWLHKQFGQHTQDPT